MGTILTFTGDDWYGNSHMYQEGEWEERIINDHQAHNNDGTSILLVDENGAVVSQLATLDPNYVSDFLFQSNYYRAFVHLRNATTASKTLDNCHRWFSNGTWYMHDGIIKEGKHLRVDSLKIGKWLDVDQDYALNQLRNIPYANVLLVNEKEDSYIVHRSKVNTLFHDGLGNFSTKPVGFCNMPVPEGYQKIFKLSDPPIDRTKLPEGGRRFE